MKIVIQAKGITLDQELREHAERRLRFALDWAKSYACRVSVRLSDLNGPRGGADKRCQIQVALPGVAEVVIEHTEENVYMAIDRAAERAGRALVRHIERSREYRHQSHRTDHQLEFVGIEKARPSQAAAGMNR